MKNALVKLQQLEKLNPTIDTLVWKVLMLAELKSDWVLTIDDMRNYKRNTISELVDIVIERAEIGSAIDMERFLAFCNTGTFAKTPTATRKKLLALFAKDGVLQSREMSELHDLETIDLELEAAKVELFKTDMCFCAAEKELAIENLVHFCRTGKWAL
jgi:hypothetical protein